MRKCTTQCGKSWPARDFSSLSNAHSWVCVCGGESLVIYRWWYIGVHARTNAVTPLPPHPLLLPPLVGTTWNVECQLCGPRISSWS